jgi:hypothetical protein
MKFTDILFLGHIGKSLDRYHKTYQYIQNNQILYPENFEPSLHGYFNKREGTFDPEVMTYLDICNYTNSCKSIIPGNSWPKKVPENMIIEMFRGTLVYNALNSTSKVSIYGYEKLVKENTQVLLFFESSTNQYIRIKIKDVEKCLTLFNIDPIKPMDNYLSNISSTNNFVDSEKIRSQIFKSITILKKPSTDKYMNRVIENYGFTLTTPITSLLKTSL